jgi:hypothetical protein
VPAAKLQADIERQGRAIWELYINRGYIASSVVAEILACPLRTKCTTAAPGSGHTVTIATTNDCSTDLANVCCRPRRTGSGSDNASLWRSPCPCRAPTRDPARDTAVPARISPISGAQLPSKTSR